METTVIIGNGVAGTTAAATLRRNGYEGTIKLIGEEAALPYQRPPLSKAWLLDSDRPKPTPLRPLTFYESNGIELMRARKVVKIDRNKRRIRFLDGKTTKFDNLILATGATPRRLDLAGADLKGIHYLRDLRDSAGLRQALNRPGCHDVVIVGAGVIGLEVASAAIDSGKAVTIIEVGGRAMARVASPAATNFITEKLSDAGVRFMFNKRLEEFGAANQHVSSINLENGIEIKADLVLVSIGATPNITLAQDAGLVCDNGICVDQDMRTSDPKIFAIGDCARGDNAFVSGKPRIETVHNASSQAQIAAATICNKTRPAPVPPRFWSDLKGMKVQAIGIAAGYDLVRSVPTQPPTSLEVHLKYRDRLVAAEVINLPHRQGELVKEISPVSFSDTK